MSNKKFLIGILMLLYGSVTAQKLYDREGAMIRSDTSQYSVYLCFTGHEHIDGFDYVLEVLEWNKIKASFFLTGDFIRKNKQIVLDMVERGHYVGAHSDRHLLYCDWDKRDSLLYNENQIKRDIESNLRALQKLNIHPTFFMPPYEWYNHKVVKIASELDQITINYSPGTRSNADYTTPDMHNYVSSDIILQSIYDYLENYGMNGFHLLVHPGTNPKRKDKFYFKLEELICRLKNEGYNFARF